MNHKIIIIIYQTIQQMPEKATDRSWIQHLQLFQTAIKSFEQHQYQEAVRKIKKSLWAQPNNSDAYYFLYLCQVQQNYPQQTLTKNLSKIRSMNPLCQYYHKKNIKNQSLEKLKKIVNCSLKFQRKILEEDGKLETSHWYNYSVMLHQETNYQRVQEMYQRLFKKYPYLYTIKSHAFLGNYANMLYDVGKYQEALAKYQIEIKLDPNQYRYFSNCAMLYTIIGNYQKAEQYIKIALNGIPNRTSFIFNYSNILFKLGRYQQSIQKTKTAISKQPSDPIFRLKLSISLILSSLSSPSTPSTPSPSSSLSTPSFPSFPSFPSSPSPNNISFSKQNLKKCLTILTKSIDQNRLELVNCNKRILSMRNVQCLQLFCQKFLLILEQNFVMLWKDLREVLGIISDYMVMGQASKILLNRKILSILRNSLTELAGKKQLLELGEDDSKEEEEGKTANVGKSKNPKNGLVRILALMSILVDWEDKFRDIVLNQQDKQQDKE